MRLITLNVVFKQPLLRREPCVQTESSLCISQSPHSICIHSCTPVWACRPALRLHFSNTCSPERRFYLLIYSDANAHQLHKSNVRSNRGLHTHPWCCGPVAGPLSHCSHSVPCYSSSPRALPLLRPTAGKANLKLPDFSGSRHQSSGNLRQSGAARLCCSVSLKSCPPPLPSVRLIWSLSPSSLLLLL